MTPKSRDFHENSTFLEHRREASRKPAGRVGDVVECIRVPRSDFSMCSSYRRRLQFFEIFEIFHVSMNANSYGKTIVARAREIGVARLRGRDAR